MVATLYVHAIAFFFQAGNPGASSWDFARCVSNERPGPVR